MQSLIDILHRETCSGVMLTSRGETVVFRRRGVIDLYEMLMTAPDAMYGASMADKVVGKGAAVLMVAGGISHVYADVVSRVALDFLRNNGVEVSYDRLTDGIMNRAGTGPCPVETLTRDAETVADALPLITDFVNNLTLT